MRARTNSVNCRFNPFKLLDLLAKLEEEDAGHSKLISLATSLLTSQVQIANLQATLHDLQSQQITASQIAGLRRLKTLIFVLGVSQNDGGKRNKLYRRLLVA